jgi:hypothetical protein
MKVTVIPAQVTTIEDRIVGNLTLKQVALLIMPIFFSAAILTFTPPFMDFSYYKIIPIAIVAILCIVL